MRVMTQGVYTALFSFSLSTVVLFVFSPFPLHMGCGLVNTCLDSLGLPFQAFIYNSHFLILRNKTL